MGEWWDKKKLEIWKLRYYWNDYGWRWRIRNILNLLDDPVDGVKHWLNGRRVFGVTIRLPAWTMRGSGDPDK